MPLLALRRLVAATLVVASAALATGCKQGDDVASDLPRPSRAFCSAAARYDKAVSEKKLSLAKHEEMTKAIARAAPKDTERDATLVWRSFAKLAAGDRSVVDNPRVKAAIDHVNRRAGQDCGWFRRQGM
jgi:hypothetical protein